MGQRSRPHWKNSSFLTDLSHLCKINKDLSQLCKTSMPEHLHIDAILSFNMHLTCLTYVPKKQHNKKRGKNIFLGQSPKQRIKMAAKGSRKQKEVYTELNRCCYLQCIGNITKRSSRNINFEMRSSIWWDNQKIQEKNQL